MYEERLGYSWTDVEINRLMEALVKYHDKSGGAEGTAPLLTCTGANIFLTPLDIQVNHPW
jgi:hypothetical protein